MRNPWQLGSLVRMSRLMPSALRLTYSSTLSRVRRLTVPTKTLGFGSTNHRLSIPRIAGGVSLATRTVMGMSKRASHKRGGGAIAGLLRRGFGGSKQCRQILGHPLENLFLFEALFKK